MVSFLPKVARGICWYRGKILKFLKNLIGPR